MWLKSNCMLSYVSRKVILLSLILNCSFLFFLCPLCTPKPPPKRNSTLNQSSQKAAFSFTSGLCTCLVTIWVPVHHHPAHFQDLTLVKFLPCVYQPSELFLPNSLDTESLKGSTWQNNLLDFKVVLVCE